MNRSRQQLINQLSADLQPVSTFGNGWSTAGWWLLINFLLAYGLMLVSAPFRPGSAMDLLEHPQFLLEGILGLSAIAALGWAAFRSGLPSATPIRKLAAPPLFLLLLWLGSYVVGLWSPALQPSMLGKREHCFLESLVLGMPAFLLAMYLIRNMWPLHGPWSGLLAGLAAGGAPALLMQFGCMYEPAHILLYHLLPGLALGLLGALLGGLLLRPRI